MWFKVSSGLYPSPCRARNPFPTQSSLSRSWSWSWIKRTTQLPAPISELNKIPEIGVDSTQTMPWKTRDRRP